jgi:3-methyladenine DNA glycosylase AlkD
MSPAAAASATRSAAQSATTERARAFVAERKGEAASLGREAGDLIHDPASLVDTLRAGLEALADPVYLAGIHHVAPGIGPVIGVRQPLLHAVTGGLRAATRRDRPASVLDVAGHLVREPMLELHWIAYGLLERTIVDEPERTWQLVRAEGRSAGNWICVDTLAHVAARGILAEPYRWAELEQLVYSPSRWERRLAGSTIATIPHTDRTAGRTPEVVHRGLAIVGDLAGDAEPDVQKALSWALRNLAAVDLPATAAFLRTEARTARDTGDGYRAWVIRDTCDKLPASLASELRDALAGIRRRPGAPSTSRASEQAASFLAYGLAVPPAERPIIDRT